MTEREKADSGQTADREPSVVRLAGVLAPVRSEPSFVTPIFATEGGDWFQRLDQGRVAGFDRVSTLEGLDVLPIVDEHGKVNIVKGDEPLYGFAFNRSDLQVAPRRELARSLSNRLADLDSEPLIRLAVAEFIGDRAQVRAAVHAAAAEIGSLDERVGYSFFCNERSLIAQTEREEWNNIRDFTLALIRFYRSYLRFLHVGNEQRRSAMRERYQSAFDRLIPLVFDVALGQALHDRISTLSAERTQYTLQFERRNSEPKMLERRIRALTRTGVSRTAAGRLLMKSMGDDASNDTGQLLALARTAIFRADGYLRREAELSRTLARAEKKIRKRQLTIGLLSIAYGVILFLRGSDKREKADAFMDTGDLTQLGLSAINAGLRDLAPSEPLLIRPRSFGEAMPPIVGVSIKRENARFE